MDQEDRDRISEIQATLAHLHSAIGGLTGYAQRAEDVERVCMLTDKYIALQQELSKVVTEMRDLAGMARESEVDMT